jgi:hypothetical protein
VVEVTEGELEEDPVGVLLFEEASCRILASDEVGVPSRLGEGLLVPALLLAPSWRRKGGGEDMEV